MEFDTKYRNEEITKIVQQMKDLHQLMNEFSKLVIEQGTVMDQIDQNVFSAHTNTVKAKEDLRHEMERETSKRSFWCITCLV